MRAGTLVMIGFVTYAALYSGYITYRDHGAFLGLKARAAEPNR